MSLLPFLLQLERPRRLLDQRYALALSPDDLMSVVTPQYRWNHHQPWSQSVLRCSESTIRTDRDKFQINLDVQHFSPEEINVKTAEGFVVVEGEHEERRDDHGWVSRRFRRRCPLPEGCDPAAVQSRLSSDGVLTVTGPLRRAHEHERTVPVVQTGPVRTKPEGVGEELIDPIETPVATGNN